MSLCICIRRAILFAAIWRCVGSIAFICSGPALIMPFICVRMAFIIPVVLPFPPIAPESLPGISFMPLMPSQWGNRANC